MKESQAKDELRKQEDMITGVFADGIKDQIKEIKVDDNTGRYHQ